MAPTFTMIPKKSKLVSLPRLIKKADIVFSLWIRARDKKCVTKNPYCSDNLQCSHLIRRGKKAVRFSEINCHAQCAHCNYLHNYEPHHYTNWFIREYGQLPYEDLCDKANTTKKFTREELEEIIRKYALDN